MAVRIRSLDWSRTPLGPIATWPPNLRTLVDLMLASRQPAYIGWGAESISFYNEGYIPILGDKHPVSLGRPYVEVWPELWDDYRDILAATLAGEAQHFIDQRVALSGRPGRPVSWFTFAWTPVRNETATVCGFYCTATETTEKILAETSRSLDHEHARTALAAQSRFLEATFSSIPDPVYAFDRSHRVAYANRALLQLQCLAERHVLGKTLDELNYPRDQAIRLNGHIDHIFRTGETIKDDIFYAGPDGTSTFFQLLWGPVLAEDGSIELVVGVSRDVTERRRLNERLRKSEEHLKAALNAGRMAHWTWNPETDEVIVSDTMRDLFGLSLGERWQMSKQGFALVHPDDRDRYQAMVEGARHHHNGWHSEFRIIRPGDGKLAWLEERSDVAVDPETGQRRIDGLVWDITHRKKTELRLRESEERFRQFAEASSNAIWIRNAKTLDMEYVSPAIATIYGMEMESFLGDMQRWAALIVPEDREDTLKHIEQARQGNATIHEFRIQRPSDLSFRWIRNTDFPLRDAHGQIQRVGGIAEDITDTKLTIEHQAVLLAELQHRVRNIMAIIQSITARTAKNVDSVADYASLMAGRLYTLARVQTLLTRGANVGIGISTLVHDELNAQAQHEEQFDANGPDVILSPKAAEILTLAVHELTTNALKYGALATSSGRIRIHWAVIEKHGAPWLSFDWSETAAPERPVPSAPHRRGFGSELIEARIPYELNGSGRMSIEPRGARCHLEFPLKEGASILETDAPQRASVFAGALDTSGHANLSGQRILVVEDDFYLAGDAARALKGSGAEVLGPCPTQAAGWNELNHTVPTGAVLDINLPDGPSFELAQELKRRGITFVFLTGYDHATIPPQFEEVMWLQKPVELRAIVSTLARALGVSSK
jgi:PAS domain S-box-containing protein